MNCYFIDYENVHICNPCDLDFVKKQDMIYLFYSKNCENLSLNLINELQEKGVFFKALKATIGSKNALDFQLSTFLGSVIYAYKNKPSTSFFIISKDTGYDAVVDFWKRQGAKIERLDCMGSTDLTSNPQNPNKNNKQKKKEANLLPMVTNSKLPSVVKKNKATKEDMLKYLTLNEYSEDLLIIFNMCESKVEIQNSLQKKCKSSKTAGKIYRKLKPLMEQKGKI